jgi:Na+/melibiose symporter-like transporter
MFNAALSFCGKAVSGVGIVLGGLILGLVGMPQHADPETVPADTVNRLGIIVGLGVQLFYLAPLFLISRYRITRKVHSEIREALALRLTAQSTDGASQISAVVEAKNGIDLEPGQTSGSDLRPSK